jgi:hypothetical protein
MVVSEADGYREEIKGRGLMVRVPAKGVPKKDPVEVETPEPPIRKGEVKVEGDPPPPPIRRSVRTAEGV